MNKTQQSAYHNILQGFQNMADEILLPRLEPEELYNVFFQLRLDHPEIFWATGFRYKYYQDSPNLIFVPEYLFEKNKVKEHQRAMQARVEKLVRPVKDKSEWEKEKFVHDFICENVRYDKLKKAYSHEIIGPLGQGVGVCEGIAKAVKVLCDALGLWCMIVICGNNPEKGIKYRHTWNIVKLGGKYYHMDVTFDNSLSHNGIRYDYFNLDDKNIFQCHFRFRLSLIFHIIEAQDRLWPVQADTGTFLFFFSGFPDQFQKFSEDFPGEISSTPVKSKHSTFFCSL